MAKTSTQYVCSECGWNGPKWYGRCPECGQWGTVEEFREAKAVAGTRTAAPGRTSRTTALHVGDGTATPVTEVGTESVRRLPTGFSEFDRVLGGGIVPGSVTLVAGEPGIGKSTLLLETAGIIAKHQPERTVLYISGEESQAQVRMRAARIDALSPNLLLAAIDYPEDLDRYLDSCILSTPIGADLIPANKRLADAAARLQVLQISQYSTLRDNGQPCELILAKLLEKLTPQYEYLIIDCGLKHELLTVNALAAADYCIIPVQSHFLASEGIPDVLETIRSVQSRFNSRLKIAGILLTMYQSRPQLCRSVCSSVHEIYGEDLHVFERPIEYSIKVAECPAAGRSILEYDPRNPAAASYRQLAQEVLQLG